MRTLKKEVIENNIHDSFVCPVCGNNEIRYIGLRNGKIYCRKCISFRGNTIEEKPISPRNVSLYLDYALSEDQAKISTRLLENFKNHKNSFVHAVCGSGKTEIVLGCIYFCLLNGLKVGFCVPRRDVIIELYDRFKDIYKDNTIALVYGGHTEIIDGDLICCTTHQLFRYERYFDLLIIDEVDAFPFKGDETLNAFFYRAIKRNFIMLSATPSEELLRKFKKDGGEVLNLNRRFHRYPLPVPEIITGNYAFLIYKVIRLNNLFIKKNKQVFIFAPTIQICENVFQIISPFCKNGNFVHSKRKDREEIISDFKQKKYKYLVTTSVLERGVTVKDLQVIVFNADHNIYNKETLVQIAGRVGRKKDAPEGRIIYAAKRKNNVMLESIRDIELSNKDLQNLF